ncbi:NADPH-dependent FMN reductase [Uliginosibacterium sp. H3]|uniref:NADPH-dependent FMN reductase n=1 Tax=Uliginosibacterium silvisoli TaxID=3114758 RepID=A0ABU6K3A8_9RHOO|nr:NADPH-dependent FMN reductase [Uliginosibacterium sp. H3]
MAIVVALAGSPSAKSRSSGLLKRGIELLVESGVTVQQFSLTDFVAEDLIYGRFDSPAVQAFNNAVKHADGLLIASPVYKAAYSGGLKTLIDLLPEHGLAGKVALNLATGGSAAFTLSLDHALLPVLNSLKIKFQVGGVFATDRDVAWQVDGSFHVAPDTEERLRLAINSFVSYLPHPLSAELAPGRLVEQIRQGRISV